MSRFICMESMGNTVWLRRADTLKVEKGSASARAMQAARPMTSMSRSHLKPQDARATPGTPRMASVHWFATSSVVPSRKKTSRRPEMRWMVTTGYAPKSASRFF